ncbi:dihydrofolate reductase [Porphyromonas canoris]|uniref:NAD(P)-dependent oxidoreductase n=1 Tax=Porphyromonas canoris TaxID=36875 RepID=UPI00051D1CC7|nr:NAD(P)-dependent oxidoreductase [Porphyromonas canoris]KGL53311.1 dihydrofolate reductase [Porphyromonas canoris]
MKLLVAFNMLREGWDELQQHFEVVFPPEGRDFTHDEIVEQVADCDVLCSVFDIPVDREIIDAGKKLKLISNYAVGYNNIDIEYAASKGIAVTNTPRSVVEPTADLALSLLLDATRNISRWDALMRKEQHALKISRLTNLGTGIHGKTLGIIGMGNIGKAFARRAQACGMKILYNKRTRYTEAEEAGLAFTYASVEEVLQQADVVSLHTPYSKETHHLIDAKALKMMKPTAILINTGRGALVDESALVEALRSGTIAAAGLDVFENKDIPSLELYSLPNVSLTPHIGTQTVDARMEMLKELSDAVIGFFHGGREVPRVV